MDQVTIGVIILAALMVVMFMGLPVWNSMILTAIVGLAVLGEPRILQGIGQITISSMLDNTFAVLPVFLIMGEFGDISGVMKDAYRSVNIWMGRIRGGLAMASVAGAAIFSLVSGSNMACAAIMTRIALPQLNEHKYDPRLSVGALAAGGSLGNLVPPGTLLVIYAIIAEVSLGKLFVACYVPGFLLAAMYMLQIYIQCKLKPSMGPAAGDFAWKEKMFALKGLVHVGLILLVTLGGIQFGVFTPNEAASISAAFIFVVAVARRMVNKQNLLTAFKNTVATTGMALAIIIGTQIFNIFVTISGVPQALASWLTGLNLSPFSVVVIIMIVYFIMGIPMSGLTIVLLTMPILLPVLHAFHIDLLWFGVLTIAQCELATLSPPVGNTLYVIAQMSKPYGISMADVFWGALPFCVTCLVFIILLLLFPSVSLFLVSQMH